MAVTDTDRKPKEALDAGKNWTSLGGFIRDAHATGARGFVIGEDHDHVGLVKSISDELKRLKQEIGLTTLYVEYVSSDNGALLEKSLQGDEKSQALLRSEFEIGWSYGRGYQDDSALPAQARYDLLFAGRDAGVRVIGIDTEGKDHSKRFAEESRTYSADPHMTENIRQNDDGNPFIVMVGKAHVYDANLPEDTPNWGYGVTREGGVDARLNAAGIPTVSISLAKNAGPFSIEKSPGGSSHFILKMPSETETVPANDSLLLMGQMERLAGVLEARAKQDASGKTGQAHESLTRIKDAYMECRVDVGMIENLPELAQQIEDIFPRRRGDALANRLHEMGGRTADGMKPEILLDKGMCEPETVQKIRRPTLDIPKFF
jgi:hypothetical protein